MMQPSAIGWCDYSGGDNNFVTGCTPVSAGCARCYARAIYDRFGRDFTPTCHQAKLDRLYKAKFPEFSPKRGAPYKPSAFICDTGDLFHPAVPDDFIALAFTMMVLRQDVTWLVLTKRPERIKEALGLLDGRQYGHILLGVTAENQAAAEVRIPLLMSHWQGIKFVSVEPMLGPVSLVRWLVPCTQWCNDSVTDDCPGSPSCRWYQPRQLSWIISGAESGPKRRHFDPEWAANLYKQCRAAGVPFYGKQDSDLRPGKPLYVYGQEVHEYPN